MAVHLRFARTGSRAYRFPGGLKRLPRRGGSGLSQSRENSVAKQQGQDRGVDQRLANIFFDQPHKMDHCGGGAEINQAVKRPPAAPQAAYRALRGGERQGTSVRKAALPMVMNGRLAMSFSMACQLKNWSSQT